MGILTKLNKILLIIAIVSALLFGAALTWYLVTPWASYEQSLLQAEEELAAAQQQLQDRTQRAMDDAAEKQSENQALTTELAQIQEQIAQKTSLRDTKAEEVQQLRDLPTLVWSIREEYGRKIRLLEEMIMAGQTEVRICYLTFDDGPNHYTGAILDKLEKHGVFVTFFTIGANSAYHQEENLRREMMGGHTIANHTYSHAYYGPVYRSLDALTTQIQLQDQKVYDATGFHTDIFRFPSGSMACSFLDRADVWLTENGYQWIDWNASGWDSGFHSFDVGGPWIAKNVLSTTKNLDIAVVLLHDFNHSTLEGIDLFIPSLQEAGFILLPLLPQSHMFDEPLPVV